MKVPKLGDRVQEQIARANAEGHRRERDQIEEAARDWLDRQVENPGPLVERILRRTVTESPELQNALERVRDVLQLGLEDLVIKEECTDDPSPWRLEHSQDTPLDGDSPIPIDGLLGDYTASLHRVRLFKQEIKKVAAILHIDVHRLCEIVRLHEAAHTVVHLAHGAGVREFTDDEFEEIDGGTRPSDLHETLAQLLCYHAVKDDTELYRAFSLLNDRQPEAYKRWERFKDVEPEVVRHTLLRTRKGRLPATFEAFEEAICKELS